MGRKTTEEQWQVSFTIEVVFWDPEDGGSTFLRNVSTNLPSCMASHHRRQYSSLSRVGVTYKRGFGLDDWIYFTLYVCTARDYRQYSAIAILHTFQFTVTHAIRFSGFTSRNLATGLSQSHCNFKPHVKSSWHPLIPFLPFLLNLQNWTQFQFELCEILVI
jgi:hypothetical protein